MVAQPIPLQRSVDGHEIQLAGNHLGAFLLVSLLLPRLRQSGPGARVVAVSSRAHRRTSIRWDDPDFKLRPSEYGTSFDQSSLVRRTHNPAEVASHLSAVMIGYAQSKLANILFVKEFAKRMAKEGILAYSLHPGSTYRHRACPRHLMLTIYR